MYEDNEQPVLRRVLLIIVWLVIIATIAWASIWLTFFRNNSSTNHNNTKRPSTSQHSQASTSAGNSKTQPGSGSSTSPGTTNQGATSAPNTGGTTTQPPQALANTGAGNVFIPFGAASIIGSAAYYIRLRKRLNQ